MYAEELLEKAKSIPGFIGVFPLDEIPQHIRAPCCFIINTQTSNLKGEHWLAITYEQNNDIHVFDSFGYYYPLILIEKLHHLPNKKIFYNSHTYQKLWENTCGQYCLAFLRQRTIINREPGSGSHF